MKKRKPKKEIEMHQHTDMNGIPFGRLHLLDVEHKNKKTQKHHNETIKRL